MMGSAVKIDFNDPSEGIPDFLTILAMPTAYSISEGIAIGVISWTLINLVTGKAKEKKISPLMYVLTVLFILKYVFLYAADLTASKKAPVLMMDGSFSASYDPEQPAHSLRAVRRGTILFLAIVVICAAGGYALPG